MPYDRWFESLTGRSLNSLLGWERNNFDRVVHFSYGLLLAYPVREVFQRVARLRGFWGYFFPIRLQRDFTAEWNESLRVKNSRPLGEDEMRRLLNRGDAA